MTEKNRKWHRPKPDHFYKPDHFHDHSRLKALLPEKPIKKEPEVIFKPLFQGEGAVAEDGDAVSGWKLPVDSVRRSRRTRKRGEE